jgi:EAL domain-containing protein (putative c-di-GMP-specific phosphodiesterase class I)/GGDEF domain-containing protein
MYTYPQLLFRNTLLGLLFNFSVTVVIIFTYSQELVQQQQLEQATLTFLADSTTENSPINTLIDLNKYSHLVIKFNNGDSTFIHNIAAENWLTNFIIAPATTIKTMKEYQVSYQLNANTVAQLIINILIMILIASAIIILLACSLSIKHSQRIVNKVSSQIKTGLSQVATSQNYQPLASHIEMPDVDAGLNQVQQLISAQKIQSTKLEKEAYIDPLTQLENRNRFIQLFADDINAIDFGVLAIIRCSELQTINKIHGYKEGDHYICQVAGIIKNALSAYPEAKVYRLNSSDFSVMLLNTSLKASENFANELSEKFNSYQQSSGHDSVGYTGLVYFEKDQPLGELLALADTGISIAQTQKTNSWYSQKDTEILNASTNYGNQNWRQEIDNVIENQRVTLLVQPIKPNNRSNKIYGEILARFLNADKDILPTASFIAMAEKLDKIVAIDKMIVEKVITEIKTKNLAELFFGINLSARSINDEHFLIWLERMLLRESAIASKLIFEITEFGLQQNIKSSKRFIDMIHRVGARVTVEHFGLGLTSFKFFRDLKPDFIKMDSSYTRDIDDDKNNQYFIHLMVDLAHRLSITVLAESVESQEEKFTLEKLFIDGCQGFYIGKPEVI